MRAYCTTLVVMILFGCHGSPAHAQILGSTEHLAGSSARIIYQGTTYDSSQQVVHSSYASSQALAGLTTTPEARTAARVSSAAIACNARLDDKFLFSFVGSNSVSNLSDAIYGATLTKISGPPERVLAHFLLPLSFVETVSFVEVPNARINSAMTAYIGTSLMGGPQEDHFFFQASLTGSFQSELHNFSATGQPGLDVTPLLNPTFTDTTAAGLRTTHLEFAPFAGVLDLGVLTQGQTLAFGYHLSARVDLSVPNGLLAGNLGIASINDPFFFDSDPVTPGIPVVFEFVPASVPEPSTLVLVSGGGLAVLGRYLARRVMRRKASRR